MCSVGSVHGKRQVARIPARPRISAFMAYQTTNIAIRISSGLLCA
jgi:hypothetical protein